MLNKRFSEVTRYKCKASIMIEGLSGSGKSGLALAIAQGLSKNDMSKTYAIDTENNSLNLFQGLPSSNGGVFQKFKKVDLTAEDGYAPSNYLELRNIAINEGAEIVIFDSITHSWQYEGGILTMVSNISANNSRGDKYAAWRDPNVVKEKNALLDLLRNPKCHMITTVRVKEKFAPEQDENGKTKIISLGEQQIMQDDIKYEPDLVLHMLQPGNALGKEIKYPQVSVIKSRYPMFSVDAVIEMTPEIIEALRTFLEEGADPSEILEQQRQDYIKGVKEYIANNPAKKPIWNILKQEQGYDKTKVEDIPIEDLKKLFNKLTI